MHLTKMQERNQCVHLFESEWKNWKKGQNTFFFFFFGFFLGFFFFMCTREPMTGGGFVDYFIGQPDTSEQTPECW